MIELRVQSCRSWFTSHGKVLAHRLAEDLVQRCRGERVLKIELTYRREEWSDPQDLYRAASEERHVRRFIERLAAVMGKNLTGKWLCKMEFQSGGWLHFHLILLGFHSIPHHVLTDTWGKGFVWIRRAGEAELRYVCKYISKDGEFPPWLFLERARSVKVIRSSPGFWPPREYPPRPERDRVQKVAYGGVTIGELIERVEGKVVARDPSTGRYLVKRVDMLALSRLLMLYPGKKSSHAGWMCLEGVQWADLERAVSALDGGAGRRQHGRSPGGGPPLHLIHSAIPPVDPNTSIVRKWLGRWFTWLAQKDYGI